MPARAAEAVLPRSVALAFHGEYVRARPKCSYFFSAYASIHSKVVADLRAHGVRVHSFFHSMASEPELDARLARAGADMSPSLARSPSLASQVRPPPPRQLHAIPLNPTRSLP